MHQQNKIEMRTYKRKTPEIKISQVFN